MKTRKKSSPSALYVHIPFCASLCPFCDFTRLIRNDDKITPYLEELKKELDSKNIDKVNTIYIGGGSPSFLNADQLNYLLSFLAPKKDKNCEFTIECNVNDLTPEKIKIMDFYGVNRISIGVQTFNKAVQRRINREATFAKFAGTISLLRENGFKNINLDFIYGLPGQTLEDIVNDIGLLASLNVEHVSFYSLIIDENSVYSINREEEIDDDTSRLYLDTIVSRLKKIGFNRYEVSNFSKKKKYRAKHNITYWKDEQYYAIGLSASGYVGDIRYKNTCSIKQYLLGNYLKEEEKVTVDSDKEYFLITNLRLAEGFLLSDYKKRFGVDFYKENRDAIEKNTKLGLLKIKGQRIYPTAEGLALLDRVLLDFFKD